MGLFDEVVNEIDASRAAAKRESEAAAQSPERKAAEARISEWAREVSNSSKRLPRPEARTDGKPSWIFQFTYPEGYIEGRIAVFKNGGWTFAEGVLGGPGTFGPPRNVYQSTNEFIGSAINIETIDRTFKERIKQLLTSGASN